VSDDLERYCLITGCAGDIGQSLVKSFRSAGYHVIGTDISAKPANMILPRYIQTDISRIVNEENYAAEFLSDIKRYTNNNGLNVLINNAAIQILGGVETLDRGDWVNTLEVNLLAPFFLTKLLLTQLEQVKGSVINISSIHATLTKSNFVAYATSKAALSGLTRSMAVDLGDRVRINAIEPAAIETRMLLAGFNNNPDQLKELKLCHPAGEIGQVDDLSKLAIAIASDGLSFLHGTCIPFDGGVRSRLYDPE
jgi:NAD(P)-dependent dehydrogenase (short-subunit alcohol dehydrogenase family)